MVDIDVKFLSLHASAMQHLGDENLSTYRRLKFLRRDFKEMCNIQFQINNDHTPQLEEIRQTLALLESGYTKELSRYSDTTHPPSEIVPHLFLGSELHAKNWSVLEQQNIKNILNITVETSCPFEEKGINYLKLSLKDNPNCSISDHFDKCFDFINGCLSRKESVLVHCQRGVSRSATIIMAYLIKHKSITFEEARDFVCERRIVADPNFGFIAQLKLFEMECQNKGTDDEEEQEDSTDEQ